MKLDWCVDSDGRLIAQWISTGFTNNQLSPQNDSLDGILGCLNAIQKQSSRDPSHFEGGLCDDCQRRLKGGHPGWIIETNQCYVFWNSKLVFMNTLKCTKSHLIICNQQCRWMIGRVQQHLHGLIASLLTEVTQL